jgi:hypothetical protein
LSTGKGREGSADENDLELRNRDIRPFLLQHLGFTY